jgi:hypothetical protein
VNKAAIFRWTRDSIPGSPRVTGHFLVHLPSKDRVLDVFALKTVIDHLFFRMGRQVIVSIDHSFSS